MNKIEITGNLTRDAESNFSKSGAMYVKFSIADNEIIKGEKTGKVIFHNCICFGDVATANQDLKKGFFITVKGTLKQEEYEGKRYYTVTVFEVKERLT